MKDNTDKTLVLIGLVCLFLLLMHFLPPMTIGDVTLRQVSILSDLSPHHTPDTPNGFSDKAGSGQDTANGNGQDTTRPALQPKGPEPIVDYSGGAACGMAHFYAMLDSLQQHKLTTRPLRIAYFADSYTEGDILTADLRELLQARYGGMGVGWVDAANDVSQYRISLAISEHGMEEHMAMKKENYNARKAGIAGRYAPFAGSASMTYKGGKRYPHASTWQVVRFYGQANRSVSLTADLGGSSFSRKLASGKIQEAICISAAPVGTTSIALRGAGTAYGTSLEGKTGIVLDNFSMRSSTGLPLGQIPSETLQAFQYLRQYDLVILSFGGNVVSPTGDADEGRWYVRKMQRVIEKFKTCFPNASIVLFGAPDFGIRKGNEVVTPESVKGLIAYQRQLAVDTKIAFYDLLAAMGGYGTAGRMHEQGLVRDDYFHISQKGGKYAAERIGKSLMAGLANFQKKKGGQQ